MSSEGWKVYLQSLNARHMLIQEPPAGFKEFSRSGVMKSFFFVADEPLADPADAPDDFDDGPGSMPSQSSRRLAPRRSSDSKRTMPKKAFCRVIGCSSPTVAYGGNPKKARAHLGEHIRESVSAADDDLSERMLGLLAMFGAKHSIPSECWNDSLFADLLDSLGTCAVEHSRQGAPIRFMPPSQDQVESSVRDMSEEVQEVVRRRMASGKVTGMMLDGWEHAGSHFIGVFARVWNMVGDKCVVNNFLIELAEFDKSRSSSVQAVLLQNCLEDHINIFPMNLPFLLFSDATAVNPATIEHMTELPDPHVHFPCGVHMLENCLKHATDFVPTVAALVAKVRENISLITSNTRLLQSIVDLDLLIRRMSNENAEERSFLTTTDVCWSSTCRMFERYVEMLPAICAAIEEDRAQIFSTETERERRGESARLQSFRALRADVENEDMPFQLEQVTEVLKTVNEALVLLQKDNVGLSTLKLAVDRLFRQMGLFVSLRLNVPLPPILTVDWLESKEACSSAVALAAAVRFQIAHRFYNTLSEEERLRTPVSDDQPRPSMAPDGDEADDDSGDELPLKRPRGPARRTRVRSPAPQVGGRSKVFAKTTSPVAAVFPLPRACADFSPETASSSDWASALYLLALFFDIRVRIDDLNVDVTFLKTITKYFLKESDPHHHSGSDDSMSPSSLDTLEPGLPDSLGSTIDSELQFFLQGRPHCAPEVVTDRRLNLETSPVELLLHRHRIPLLFDLAVTILTIPVGAVDNERVFYSARAAQLYHQSSTAQALKSSLLLVHNLPQVEDELRSELS